ncbi:unnamed protein product [Ectocarpus sp. CCAP 1310/34]|nr:unnamed protein product [Ectocarpus sp. CCAP 1310/34]
MNSGDNSVTTLKSQTFIFPVKYCPKPSHCLIEYLIRTERWYDQRIDSAGHVSQPNNERNKS